MVCIGGRFLTHPVWFLVSIIIIPVFRVTVTTIHVVMTATAIRSFRAGIVTASSAIHSFPSSVMMTAIFAAIHIVVVAVAIATSFIFTMRATGSMIPSAVATTRFIAVLIHCPFDSNTYKNVKRGFNLHHLFDYFLH